MNWDITTLKNMARKALQGSYWKSVLVGFMLMLCTATTSSRAVNLVNETEEQTGMDLTDRLDIFRTPYFSLVLGVLALVALLAGIGGLALQVFALNPLEIGIRRYFMEDLYAPCEVDRLAYGFKGNYLNVVLIMLTRYVFTMLWSLLFIIPGIIKSYEYRMIPYLLAENPDLTRQEAFAMSRIMMDGEKMNAFVFDLSFIGWQFLSAVTFGLVGIFYSNPYKGLADAALYMALREKVQMQSPYA